MCKELRVFKAGSGKSHLYIPGEDKAICNTQTLRSKDSEELPKFRKTEVYDLCDVCKDKYPQIVVSGTPTIIRDLESVVEELRHLQFEEGRKEKGYGVFSPVYQNGLSLAFEDSAAKVKEVIEEHKQWQ